MGPSISTPSQTLLLTLSPLLGLRNQESLEGCGGRTQDILALIPNLLGILKFEGGWTIWGCQWQSLEHTPKVTGLYRSLHRIQSNSGRWSWCESQLFPTLWVLQWWFCPGSGMRRPREELFGNSWPLSLCAAIFSPLSPETASPLSLPDSHLWLWNSASHQIPPGCPFGSMVWKLSPGYKLEAITVLTTFVFPLKGIIVPYDQLSNVQKRLFHLFFSFFWLFSCLRQDGQVGPLLLLGQKQKFVRDVF